jgi:hypothetical protein
MTWNELNTKSAELGLLDQSRFLNAFGSERKAVVESFFENWLRSKTELFAILPTPDDRLQPERKAEIEAAVVDLIVAPAKAGARPAV